MSYIIKSGRCRGSQCKKIRRDRNTFYNVVSQAVGVDDAALVLRRHAVQYITKNWSRFAQYLKVDNASYCEYMEKEQPFATRIEMQALAEMHKFQIILIERGDIISVINPNQEKQIAINTVFPNKMLLGNGDTHYDLVVKLVWNTTQGDRQEVRNPGSVVKPDVILW